MASAWQKTFGQTAKSCFKITSDMKAYGTCMSRELKRFGKGKTIKAASKKKKGKKK